MGSERKDLLVTLKALNKVSQAINKDIIENENSKYCLSDVKNAHRKIENTMLKLFQVEIKQVVKDLY